MIARLVSKIRTTYRSLSKVAFAITRRSKVMGGHSRRSSENGLRRARKANKYKGCGYCSKEFQCPVPNEVSTSNHSRTVSSSNKSADPTSSQFQPSFKRTIAFARRATRCSTRPSRATAISAPRSAADKNPGRIINHTRIHLAPGVNQRLLGSSLSRGIAGNLGVETGSIQSASATTQSRISGEFLAEGKLPRIGVVVWQRPVSHPKSQILAQR